jgi:hypothetical protein
MQEDREGSGDIVFDGALLASFNEKLSSSAQLCPDSIDRLDLGCSKC